MRSLSSLSVVCLAVAAGLLLPAQDAQAQVALGVHGSLVDVKGATWGGGGRLALALSQSEALTVVVEGVADYLVPDCVEADCKILAYQGNLLFRRGFPRVGEGYLGLGVIYEDYTVEGLPVETDGTDWGFNLVLGTQGTVGKVRPFGEVRASFMGDLANQLGFSVGLRVILG